MTDVAGQIRLPCRLRKRTRIAVQISGTRKRATKEGMAVFDPIKVKHIAADHAAKGIMTTEKQVTSSSNLLQVVFIVRLPYQDNAVGKGRLHMDKGIQKR